MIYMENQHIDKVLENKYVLNIRTSIIERIV